MRVTRLLPVLGAAILGAIFLASTVRAQTAEGEQAIQDGANVGLEYTLSDEQGNMIESNKGKDPLKYTHGQGQIIRGLENGLKGMRVDEQKTIRVKPEDAYGQINPGALREVPQKSIPAEALKVGSKLVAQNAQGQRFPVRVHEIKEKTVVLDFNHPLAGKTLTFEVKVLSIEPVEKE